MSVNYATAGEKYPKGKKMKRQIKVKQSALEFRRSKRESHKTRYNCVAILSLNVYA